MTEYQCLHQFFGAYANLDWIDEYPSIGSALAAFLAESDQSTIVGTGREIALLLARTPSEEVLEAVVMALGCGYRPYADGATYRQWLEDVRRAIADADNSRSG